MRLPVLALLGLAGCSASWSEIDGHLEDILPDILEPLDLDGDGYKDDVDCDDRNASVHPDAAEVCDGVDNDCDTDVDDEAVDMQTVYADVDLDGYGALDAEPVQTCTVASGFATTNTDCDDARADVHPGANEECTDEEDLNCDGSVGAVDNDGDGFAACEECDDASAAAYPGAPEVCDDLDNDCNGVVDTDAPDQPTWYEDLDGDGYGVDDAAVVSCDMPAGYAPLGGDCDDGSTAYHPDAPEIDCEDPADYNCDGSSGYADNDGDGFPACTECDDGSAAVNPDATELCNDVDDDCDRTIDEDDAADAPTWYRDADADTYGNAALTDVACDAPAGYVASSTDCDDTRASDRPGATEYCDDRDNDCDATVDEPDAADAGTWYADDDADTFGDADVSQTACDQPAGYVSVGTDCDDADDSAWPSAPEYCDGADDDCDGTIDEDDALDASTWYQDGDGDTYGNPSASDIACNAPSGYVASRTDCDDTDSGVNPAASEYCDGEDDDCDGTTDETSAVDASTWYRDSDSDSYGDADATTPACTVPAGYVSNDDDCDDTSSAVRPGASEVCDDIDNDCDGSIDPDTSADVVTWYRDADTDGYGWAATTDVDCDQPSGYVSNDDDCDDTRNTSNPAASERCDSRDNDCDGTTDENSAIDATTYYADDDEDSYGDAGSPYAACSRPTGYVSNDDDCDDTDVSINPDGTETCDDVDEDCDGTIDDNASDATTWYADADNDTYGSSATSQAACDQPAGYVSNDDDCDDSTNAVSPADAEADNLLDDDCDTLVDEDFIAAGDLVISEIARQTWVGGTGTNANGNWFEVFNDSADTIDLSGWTIRRQDSSTTQSFTVDPADGLQIAAGEYIVFCKTDDYTSAATLASATSTLVCDYVWGEGFTGSYGSSSLALVVSADSLTLSMGGTTIDTLSWATTSSWPGQALYSISLNPANMDASSNDSASNWCRSDSSGASNKWFDVSGGGTYDEYGTPGAANDCP